VLGGESGGVSDAPATDQQLRRLFALFGEAGITERDDRIEYFRRVLHGGLSSSKELTVSEAGRLIDQLEADVLFNDPRRIFEAARARKMLGKRDLLDALSGRRPTGGEAARSGSFDGGARSPTPAPPEAHEETLPRVLRTRESNVGRRL
jgi:hypothetical protein